MRRLKRCTRLIIASMLAIQLFTGNALTIIAAETGETAVDNARENAARQQIEEIRRQQEENNANTSQTQNKLNEAEAGRDAAAGTRDALASQAGNLRTQVDNLTSNLNAVTADIARAEDNIASLNKEINDIEKDLEAAKLAQQQAYDGLKSRITFLYENNTRDSLLASLLMSASFADFLRRIEYVNALMAYDDEVLSDYEKLVSDIEKKNEELNSKYDELEDEKDTLESKQNEVGNLVASAKGSLVLKEGEVNAANAQVEAYEDQIENYEALLAEYETKRRNLEAAQAAAQASLAQALAEQQGDGVKEDTSGAVVASASDVALLAATIQAEADNQPYEGKLAVASVIMNRVNSSLFAQNTISGVITAPGQFASYSSGKVALILERGPNETCMSVAQSAINGARNGDWLFFMTQYWADYYGVPDYTMIGAHAFFYSWPKRQATPEPTPEPAPAEEAAPAEAAPAEEAAPAQ